MSWTLSIAVACVALSNIINTFRLRDLEKRVKRAEEWQRARTWGGLE